MLGAGQTPIRMLIPGEREGHVRVWDKVEETAMRPLGPLVKNIQGLLETARIPGCSIGVMGPNEILWSHGFGCADVARDRPADRSTVYQLFSGTKLFTATAILELVEGGELNLDAKMKTYLPDLPKLHEITLGAFSKLQSSAKLLTEDRLELLF